MKKLAFALLALGLGGTALLAQQLPNPLAQTTPLSANETVVEEIVARINSSIVSQSDLRRARERLIEDAHQDPNVTDAQIKDHEKDLLRDLIDQQLLLQQAEQMNISADTDVVKRLDEIRKQMHAESMEDVEKAAQAQGVSFEEFKQNLKNSIITQRVIGEQVGGHISVTQQEIQQFYDQHRSEMERPEQVRLSEILISTQPAADPAKTAKGDSATPQTPNSDPVAKAQATANEIYKKLEGGAKFDALAKQYSNGPTAANGGDLEYFKRGTLSKEIEDKAFATPVGKYTEPIRTNQGFLILEVTEHQQAGIPPLKDVQSQIQQQVYMQKMQPALRDYLTKLREDAYIDIKPGYVDTGASPNETKPVYTTAAEQNAKKLKKKKKMGIF